MAKFISLLWLLTISQAVSSQSIYYIHPNNSGVVDHIFYFGMFDVQTCKDSVIFQIKNTNNIAFIRDIAVCPDGEFYLSLSINTPPWEQLGRLNFQDSTITPIADFNAGLAMVCDSWGVLWMGSTLTSYDTGNGQLNDYGFIGYNLAGDLTFHNGLLYGTTQSNELIEIDPQNLVATHVVYEYAIQENAQALGIVSNAVSCDSSTTYIIATEIVGSLGFIDSLTTIYSVDPVAQTTTFVCNVSHSMWGATSPTEYLASNCSLSLDLDADNSSGASGSDWQAPLLCAGHELMLSDTDATWYSGYHTDSMRVRLLAPVPDGPLEYLTATGSGTVSVLGQGTGWLTLQGASNTAVTVLNVDFQAVVRSLRWHNDAVQPVAGLRTVEVIAFASGNRRDTAYATLEVPLLLSAGADTSISICAESEPFALLTPGAASGGIWSATTAGNGVYSPAVDAPGVYNYMVDNGACPADTADVLVSVLPLPTFSLGQDTSVCSGATLLLTVPGNATWQDGSVSNVHTASDPGLYWAALTDGNGCAFRDSILLTVKPPVTGQSTAQQCAGQAYNWNGQPFFRDTVVCVAYTTALGCDSTHCLSVTFFYPEISLDTAICGNETFAWHGKTYANAGTYQDTVQIGGCLTVAHLTLGHHPVFQKTATVSICEGEAYVVGNQSFNATGVYPVMLQTALGCDSLVTLHLTVKPPAMSLDMAVVCPGASYLFNGMSLTQPGTYSALLQTPEGCDSTVNLTLTNWQVAQVQITGDTVLCHGAMTTLSAAGFAGYQWSNGAVESQIIVSESGVYGITATDDHGCATEAEATISVLPPIGSNWTTGDPLCHGGEDGFIGFEGSAGGVGALQFSLNGQGSPGSGQFSGLAAGNYQVEITDSVGCRELYAATLADPPELAVELGASPTLAAGATYPVVVQVNQQGQFTYFWSPATGISCTDCASPVITAIDSILYTVLITSELGCVASDSLWVLAEQGEGIYIPQIFSPNGDGKNDVFTIFGDPSRVEGIKTLRIFDRWGEQLYMREGAAVNDESAGWDGKLRGRLVLPGVYVWYAEIRMKDGSLVVKKGDLTVVR